MNHLIAPIRYSSCVCGRVRCRAIGTPILSAVCYCDDCQEGARHIEALPNAASFRDADGGTPLLTYRDDRFTCLAGADLLVGYRIKENAPTRRMVASCCNSAMYLKYQPGFWVSAYRARFAGEVPPLEMRTQVQHRRADADLPRDVPCYPGFPMRLFAKIFTARISMFLGR
uniref:CENP-V/GFA domain-containing protein n=1 Tax=Rhodopseudomonas palustris (strain BisA53) TaxID=316055 RepID=Q07LB5_RHOP5